MNGVKREKKRKLWLPFGGEGRSRNSSMDAFVQEGVEAGSWSNSGLNGRRTTMKNPLRIGLTRSS
ncbi:MAG: hypothetical protein ABSA66_17695 [Roseiarcus sp.]|jgi:hypothetical protein